MLFWRPRAGLKQMYFGELDCKTHVNSESLRSSFEIPAVKDKDEIRILHLGDSWVFGLGLQDEETYSYLLDKKLKERFPHKKITSINGGTFGYSAAQVYIFLKYRAVKYNPDIIIVKNALNHNVLKAYEKIYPVSYPAVFRGVRDLLWRSQGYHYIRRLIYIGTMKNELSVRQDVDYNDDSYEAAIFQEIIKMCKKRRIKLYFLNLEFANPHTDYQFIENAMSKTAKKNNVLYVELLLDGTIGS